MSRICPSLVYITHTSMVLKTLDRTMIRVAIIDDHAVMRMGMKYALGADGEMDVDWFRFSG